MAILGSTYVELKEGFSIDNNSTILMDVQPCIAPYVGQRIMSPSDISRPPEAFYIRHKYKQ